VLNIKDLIRRGDSDEEIEHYLLNSFTNRPKDGREAEMQRNMNDPVHESMATIGG
jgi:cyclic pyranopterin phosphate synthase